jgi:protocatechuate 3,4-dioxygenase beta subunit
MLYGRRWSQVSVFAFLVAGMAHAVEAQVGRGAVSGRIVDPAGSAVPGATVTVDEAGTNRSRTVVTGTDGNYAVQGLAPGTYRVRVELSGFRTDLVSTAGGRARTNTCSTGISPRTRRRLVHRTPPWEPPLLERSPWRAIPGSFNSR